MHETGLLSFSQPATAIYAAAALLACFASLLF
jgi:hypothetical protein